MALMTILVPKVELTHRLMTCQIRLYPLYLNGKEVESMPIFLVVLTTGNQKYLWLKGD